MTKQPAPSRTMPSACIPPWACGDIVRRELAVPSSTANRWHPEEAKVCQTPGPKTVRVKENGTIATAAVARTLREQAPPVLERCIPRLALVQCALRVLAQVYFTTGAREQGT